MTSTLFCEGCKTTLFEDDFVNIHYSDDGICFFCSLTCKLQYLFADPEIELLQ